MKDEDSEAQVQLSPNLLFTYNSSQRLRLLLHS